MLCVTVFKMDFFHATKRVARFVCSPDDFLKYIVENPGMYYEVFEVPILEKPSI